MLCVCFFNVLVTSAGSYLYSYQDHHPVCIDIFQLEAEDTDCKDDLSKKDALSSGLVRFNYFKALKKEVGDASLETNFNNEAAIQYFYPHVPTPPPNSFCLRIG